MSGVRQDRSSASPRECRSSLGGLRGAAASPRECREALVPSRRECRGLSKPSAASQGLSQTGILPLSCSHSGPQLLYISRRATAVHKGGGLRRALASWSAVSRASLSSTEMASPAAAASAPLCLALRAANRRGSRAGSGSFEEPRRVGRRCRTHSLS